jgi:hypothetical protein
LRGINLITSREDGTSEWDDPKLLDRAAELGCVLFTRDYNLLQEATSRQRTNISFHGVVYAHQMRVSIGDCIRDLEMLVIQKI